MYRNTGKLCSLMYTGMYFRLFSKHLMYVRGTMYSYVRIMCFRQAMIHFV